MFQTSEPVCHLLYPAIGDLFFKVLSNFVCPKELSRSDGSRKTTYDLGKVNTDKVKLLSLDNVVFGNEVKAELNMIAKGGTDVTTLKKSFLNAYSKLFKSFQVPRYITMEK